MSSRGGAACYCYILECADGSYYTGWTTDPVKRLNAHSAGRGSRYTRSRRPVKLVLLERQADRISAMKRERAIKGMTRSRKQQLVSEGPAESGLARNKRSRRAHPEASVRE